MNYRDAAVCIVTRGNLVLMLRHRPPGKVHCALPGGRIEPGEAPKDAALRALSQQCGAEGKIVRKLAEYYYPMGKGATVHSFHIDLLGEAAASDAVCWLTLDQMSVRDRIFLWSAGLAGVPYFFGELLHGAIDE